VLPLLPLLFVEPPPVLPATDVVVVPEPVAALEVVLVTPPRLVLAVLLVRTVPPLVVPRPLEPLLPLALPPVGPTRPLAPSLHAANSTQRIIAVRHRATREVYSSDLRVGTRVLGPLCSRRVKLAVTLKSVVALVGALLWYRRLRWGRTVVTKART
jgi:hypothetical protein